MTLVFHRKWTEQDLHVTADALECAAGEGTGGLKFEVETCQEGIKAGV